MVCLRSVYRPSPVMNKTRSNTFAGAFARVLVGGMKLGVSGKAVTALPPSCHPRGVGPLPDSGLSFPSSDRTSARRSPSLDSLRQSLLSQIHLP